MDFLLAWAYSTRLRHWELLAAADPATRIGLDKESRSQYAQLIVAAAEPGAAVGPGTTSWGNKLSTTKWAAEAALRHLGCAPEPAAPAPAPVPGPAAAP